MKKKLVLDHNQRLNLVALMGAQKGNVADTRIWWRLMELLDLGPAEKVAAGVKVQELPGGSYTIWDRKAPVLPMEYELEKQDFRKLRTLVNTWGGFTPADRFWLEPLLEQLDIDE